MRHGIRAKKILVVSVILGQMCWSFCRFSVIGWSLNLGCGEIRMNDQENDTNNLKQVTKLEHN